MILNKVAEELRGSFTEGKPKDWEFFPAWAEYKYDGEFVAVFVAKSKAVIANRHKTVYPVPSYICKYLPTQPCVLSAEFISLRGGLYQFLSDRANLENPNLGLRIFNIHFWKGRKLDEESYSVKREILETLFDNGIESVRLVESEKVSSKREIADFYEKALLDGVEGIVVKDRTLRFLMKIKPTNPLDVVVMGITKTKSWREEKIPYSFLVGTRVNGRLTAIGRAGCGLSIKQKKQLGELLVESKISEDKTYIYVVPEQVLEIVYQQICEKGLRHPRIRRWRRDKGIKHVSEAPFEVIQEREVEVCA